MFIPDYKLDSTPFDLVPPDLFLGDEPHRGQAVLFSELPLIFLDLLALSGGNS